MKQLVRDGHRSDVPTLEPCLRVTLLCKLNGQACETGAPEGVSRVGEHLFPGSRDVAVDDDGLDQAGIEHVERILIFDVVGRWPRHDLRLALLAEVFVESEQVSFANTGISQ